MLRRALISLGVLGVSLLMAGSLGASAAHAALTYKYATGQQAWSSGSIPTLAKASLTVWNPTIAAGDFHSLAELAVADDDQSEAIEVGWQKVAGGSGPELFGHWWKGGTACGYNGVSGCGVTSPWVDNPAVSLNLGDSLTASTSGGTTITLKVGIQYDNTVSCGTASAGWWLIAYYSTGSSQFVGCYKDTNWSGVTPTFNNAHQVKAYGEVAANVASPTTQMGSGVCGSVATLNTTAFIGSVQTNLGLASLSYSTTNSAQYSLSSVSASSFYYGGDGSCP